MKTCGVQIGRMPLHWDLKSYAIITCNNEAFMDKQKTDNQGTMKIIRFEAGGLQTGTATTGTANESSAVLNLNVQTNSGQNNPKPL